MNAMIFFNYYLWLKTEWNILLSLVFEMDYHNWKKCIPRRRLYLYQNYWIRRSLHLHIADAVQLLPNQTKMLAVFIHKRHMFFCATCKPFTKLSKDDWYRSRRCMLLLYHSEWMACLICQKKFNYKNEYLHYTQKIYSTNFFKYINLNRTVKLRIVLLKR